MLDEHDGRVQLTPTMSDHFLFVFSHIPTLEQRVVQIREPICAGLAQLYTKS